LLEAAIGGSEMTFLKSVEDTGWLMHVRRILSGTCLVLDKMHSGKGKNVLVHCSDGWDRTSQICALAQILMDPYVFDFSPFLLLLLSLSLSLSLSNQPHTPQVLSHNRGIESCNRKGLASCGSSVS